MMNEKRLLAEFLELVQTDSQTGDEREICDLLTKKLTELGFDVVEDDSARVTGHGSGNLIATLAPTQENTSRIYFTAHMDTVAPGKGVQPSLQEGYVVTDGTTTLGADDKAGLAAMLEGVRSLQEQKLPHGQIQFIITAGEESGLVGAKNLDHSFVQADYGFAIDSNGPVGQIYNSAVAKASLFATIIGKPAHAGVNPEDGKSAIEVACRAIAHMKLGRIDDETTANVGKYDGGTAMNVVAERVELVAEARSRNNEKLQAQLDHMVTTIEKTALSMGVRADIDVHNMYSAYSFSEQDEVVQKAIAAVKEIGRTPELKASGGGSDANVIASLGIPTVNLGIGYEEIHTTNERMPVQELVKAAELVLALIKGASNK
ncbi:M20/M25/M40 family metallo-hydrolase [Mechercharimyces sp. CAU 1602]|uniref:M20/M25/M40 family metallo-hydrolase n=1 Tax=Mechercharimyces sp. CAU 1602 TaxID=2973933 RepID=UPI002161622F|nr:M20/M25/M40 family metallo-hydrolase [Mechercharimyces sp. CAU 1602]MCS1350818.1 M20/M25/M40 family metallo-hydrolase [Mechercharimyces sp. CAU 1602]